MSLTTPSLRRLLVRELSHYSGLQERAAPGVHAACVKLLNEHISANALPAQELLDIAAGNGAFIRRMQDIGVRSIDAIEIDLKHFSIPEITPLPLDLNTGFSKDIRKRYSLISAIEIIEHLDCPRAFLRHTRELLKEDGKLLLTTPNIEHWLARVKYLLNGELQYFTPADYHDQRHISPITDYHMKLMFREIGLKLIAQSSGGSFWGPLKRFFYWPFGLLSKLLKGHIAKSDANIYLVRKIEPEKFPGSDSFYF